MGLGLLGRGVGDIIFLAEQGALEIIVTDIKTEEDLFESVDKIRHFKNVKLVLGEHRLEDFRDRDFIIKGNGVPLDSLYVAEAQKNSIPVEMSTALFASFDPGTIIGITGTRGKTTVTHIIFETLKLAGKKVFLGGNIQGVSTLAHLVDSTSDEIAVLELDSWQLQGFGERKISPHISVFTNLMPDHLNYYKGDVNKYFDDKSYIFKFQEEKDVFVLGERVVKMIDDVYSLKSIKSQKIIASPEDVSEKWNIQIPGEHNLYNIACAVEALRAFGISDTDIQSGVENFTGVAGRLELVKEYDGIKIYNDTTATTPEATLAGLRAVATDKNTVLICGGSYKDIDPSKLAEQIDLYAKVVVTIPGTGTDRLLPLLLGKDVKIEKTETLEEAFIKARDVAVSGDVILFSPAFASFGMFKNEYDRGDQFNTLVKK